MDSTAWWIPTQACAMLDSGNKCSATYYNACYDQLSIHNIDVQETRDGKFLSLVFNLSPTGLK